MNALLDANRAIVERARTHVGNLAHAIKTPLSVIVNEANSRGIDPFASKVLEQADVMRDQVTHHLERARIAARVTIVGTVTDVAPALEALCRTMQKIHRDRGITIDLEADAAAKFRGEKQDIEEMVGNLVDNACKWADSHVTIGVQVERTGGADPASKLRIIVDDDGRGLSDTERAQVARRGQRLDETKPGSGLGLSIVVDLAALYGGSLTLGKAPIGGLRAELVLPGVSSSGLVAPRCRPNYPVRNVFDVSCVPVCVRGLRSMVKFNAFCVAAVALALGGCDVTTSDGGLGLGTDTIARAYSSTKSAVGLSEENAAVGGDQCRLWRADRRQTRRPAQRRGPPAGLRGPDRRPRPRCTRRSGALAQRHVGTLWQYCCWPGL